MKVYALPGELAATVPAFDFEGGWEKKEEAHREEIRAWLKQAGYTGKNSGKILRESVADGYAEYMVAEGSKTFLLHLPYGDAYQAPYVHRMTKKDVLDSIRAQERLDELFNRNKGA